MQEADAGFRVFVLWQMTEAWHYQSTGYCFTLLAWISATIETFTPRSQPTYQHVSSHQGDHCSAPQSQLLSIVASQVWWCSLLDTLATHPSCLYYARNRTTACSTAVDPVYKHHRHRKKADSTKHEPANDSVFILTTADFYFDQFRLIPLADGHFKCHWNLWHFFSAMLIPILFESIYFHLSRLHSYLVRFPLD